MIVYVAINKMDGKVYVGKTIHSLLVRKHGHLDDMRRGSNFHFHNALRKYSPESFDWQVIDQAETEQELNEKEKYWIQFYKSFDPVFGYNLTLGGDGVVPTEETRQKMSTSLKGKPGTFLGRKHTEETKKKIGSSRLGKRSPMLGKKMSDGSKLKVSQARKGVSLSEEHKKKLSESLKKHYQLVALGRG